MNLRHTKFLKFAFRALTYSVLSANLLLTVEAQTVSSQKMISLREVIDNALLQNRQLQIERINPDIQRMTLRAARGFYDPLFSTRVHAEHAEDTGGFDPANFSADAVFDADSEVVTTGLSGFLP